MSHSPFRVLLVALGLFAETAIANAAIIYSVTFVDPGNAHSASYAAIFARINNLTDEKYAEVFGFPALGRAAYGGLRCGFKQTSRSGGLQTAVWKDGRFGKRPSLFARRKSFGAFGDY
jgi:hypothetical protein